MKSFKSLAIFVAILTTSIYAAPTAVNANDDLAIIMRQDLGETGNLTSYGNAPSVSARSALRHVERQSCGSNTVECNGSNQANVFLCNRLFNSLTANPDVTVGPTQSLCLEEAGSACCISWSANVGTFRQINLLPAAEAARDRCASTTVSGLARNVQIGTGCVTQCLSNRRTGCR
jgi:hypothetical protein